MKNSKKLVLLMAVFMIFGCQKEATIDDQFITSDYTEEEIIAAALEDLSITDVKSLEAEYQSILTKSWRRNHRGPRPDIQRLVDSFDEHPVGYSKLYRVSGGVYYKIYGKELPPGHALTVWFAIFNYPEKCASSPCTFDDALNPETGFSLINAGGRVVNQERGCLWGYVERGQNKYNSAIPFFQSLGIPVGEDQGHIRPLTAEYHLHIRSHGPAVDELLEEQLSYYEGGCVNFVDFNDPPEYADEVGDCSDFQHVFHLPH